MLQEISVIYRVYNSFLDSIVWIVPKAFSFLPTRNLTRIEIPQYMERCVMEVVVNCILCKHLHKMAYVNNYIMSPSATFLQNVV